MTKEEWRRLDRQTGQRFRLIADGRVGEAMRYHKDAAVVKFRTAVGAEDIKYCPCEMLQDPDAPWVKPAVTRPAGERKKPYQRVCQHCGKTFYSAKKDAKYCSRNCKSKAVQARYREKRLAENGKGRR